MVKWWILATFVVAVLADKPKGSSENYPQCIGGESDLWRDGSKVCSCVDGKPVCKPLKNKALWESTGDSKECIGRPVWFKDCNSCRCIGENAACTKMNCDKGITNRIYTFKPTSAYTCSKRERARCPEYNLVEFMAAKGCKPVYKKNRCCASRFKCIKNFAKKVKGKCFFNDRFYKGGEAVQSDNPCLSKCKCDDEIIKCEFVECNSPPPAPGPAPPLERSSMPAPGAVLPPGPITQPGCFKTFTEGQCCPTGETCPTNTTRTCVKEPFPVYEGQMFIVEGGQFPDNCQNCLCTSSFSGPYGPGCKPFKFLIDYPLQADTPFNKFTRNKIVSGCVPVSGRTSCFNTRFVCPGEISVKPNQGPKKGGKDKCKFGDVFIRKGETLQFTVQQNFKCECIAPPDVLCTFLETNQPPPGELPPGQLPIGGSPTSPSASQQQPSK